MATFFGKKRAINSPYVTLSCFTVETTKGGSIIVPLTSCLTGLDLSVLQIKTKIVSYHTADSKPIKQEVNGTVILPPLVLPVYGMYFEPVYGNNFCHILIS